LDVGKYILTKWDASITFPYQNVPNNDIYINWKGKKKIRGRGYKFINGKTT
jgi:hypothetical protein